MTLAHRPDFLDYRRDGDLGVDVLGAAFSGPAFDRHAHATFAIGLTTRGYQAFSHRGVRHVSTPGRIIAFNPEDPHDGGAADAAGFAYWMLYPDVGVWERALEDATGDGMAPHFGQTLLEDPDLARLFFRLAPILWTRAGGAGPGNGGGESLAAECGLDLLLLALAARHGKRPVAVRAMADDRVVARVRDRLHAEFASDIRLDDLAAAAGRSRFQITRAFQAATGLPPHRYLTSIRLERARGLLASGEPVAEVAAAVGFADQSHLTRRFKAAYGVTPGRFQAAYGARTNVQA
jgi:AraC-like DNA-binding protein